MADSFASLAADLRKAGTAAQIEGVKVVAKGAHNVKKAWQTNVEASSGRSAPRAASAVTYDMEAGAGEIRAEIGYDRARVQGNLGHILENGSPTSPGHQDGQRALDEEEPRYLANIEQLSRRLL